jgi:hypothetical protein
MFKNHSNSTIYGTVCKYKHAVAYKLCTQIVTASLCVTKLTTRALMCVLAHLRVCLSAKSNTTYMAQCMQQLQMYAIVSCAVAAAYIYIYIMHSVQRTESLCEGSQAEVRS